MIRYFIIAAILFSGCSLKENKRLVDFNSKLGMEKSASLDKITASFEGYLSARYPELDKHDFHDKFCYFLHDIAEHDASYYQELTIPDSIAIIIARDCQLSGLDKELYIEVTDSAYLAHHSPSDTEIIIAGSSEYEADLETVPDSLVLSDFNLYGDYHQALSKIQDADFISNYIAAREMQGDMTLPVLLPTFIDYCDKSDFNDPVIKRIVTMEIYMQIVYYSLK